MTKSKKLKVMTEVKNDAPKLREAKGEAKSEEIKVPLAVQVKYLKPVKAKKVKEVKEHVEAKPDPELDRALEALRKLGKVGTPELVKELGYTGESRRDRVRRLMDRLHDKGLIHRTHEGKHYVYEAKETTTQQTATVETIKEVAA